MIEFANDGEMLTVGKLLKNERERQELTIEDISDRTKIHVKYIRAIEEERKDQFPGDLYYDLFTKSYADALGLEYAKIKAGTFSAADSRGGVKGKGAGKESRVDQVSKKADWDKSKEADRRKTSDRKSAAYDTSLKAPIEMAETGADSEDVGEPESGGAGAAEEEIPSTKPEITKYLVVTAAIIICLFIVFLYISISSRQPAPPDEQQQREPVGSSRQNLEQLTLDDQIAAIEDSVRTAALSRAGSDTMMLETTQDRVDAQVDDTLGEGPVWIYPESLEVTLVATQESWASVVADGDTVFMSFFRPDNVNTFKALTELDLALGRWEYVTGSIYGHPLKPMRNFHIEGNNAVRLRITKENWESFIDSTKARNEQD